MARNVKVSVYERIVKNVIVTSRVLVTFKYPTWLAGTDPDRHKSKFRPTEQIKKTCRVEGKLC
jgi:hypothetical protein